MFARGRGAVTCLEDLNADVGVALHAQPQLPAREIGAGGGFLKSFQEFSRVFRKWGMDALESEGRRVREGEFPRVLERGRRSMRKWGKENPGLDAQTGA